MLHWLRKIFRLRRAGRANSTIDYSGIPHRNFFGAGVTFTDGVHILAAEQLFKNGALSGFGGKRNGSENYFHNAYREFLEEAFGVIDKGVQDRIIEKIIRHVIARNIRFEDGDPCYVNIIHNFKDLEEMLLICKRIIRYTQYYAEFPLTVGDLVCKRIHTRYAEIGDLFLIPVRAHSIEMEFLMDMKYVSNHLSAYGGDLTKNPLMGLHQRAHSMNEMAHAGHAVDVRRPVSLPDHK